MDAVAKTDRSGGLEEGPREGFQEEEAEERERGNKKECPLEPEVERKEGSREAGDAGKSDLYRPQGLPGGYGPEFPAAAAQKVGWLWASPKAERGAGTLLESPREDSATGAKALLTEVGRQTRVGEGFGRKTCQGEEGCRGRGRRVEGRRGHPGSWHQYLCLVMVVGERGVGQVGEGC